MKLTRPSRNKLWNDAFSFPLPV